MAEKPILVFPQAGDKIKASVYTNNFHKWDDYLDSTIVELNAKVKEYVVSKIDSLTTTIANTRLIGQPIIRLDNTILDDEIRLEGAEVSRETYASLFSLYGTTYGEGNGVTTFNLPDFRNRAVWGASDFGYIEAGLPNITGSFGTNLFYPEAEWTGAFKRGKGVGGKWDAAGGTTLYHTDFEASLASPVYGKSDTVQPSAIKVRVVTRYK